MSCRRLHWGYQNMRCRTIRVGVRLPFFDQGAPFADPNFTFGEQGEVVGGIDDGAEVAFSNLGP